MAPRAGLALPGGGIFFWWQAGALHELSSRYRLSEVPVVGASAGALAATIGATGVDVPTAFDLAASLAERSGAWERGAWGLVGVWGPMIREWLDELLPADADEQCRGRVHILVKRAPRLRAPRFEPLLLSDYRDRDDLIDVNMASAHLPLFIDGHWTARVRGMRCVDGTLSLRKTSAERRVVLPGGAAAVRLDSAADARMRARYSRREDFVRLASRDGVAEMMEWGMAHAREMERRGELEALEPFRLP